MSVLATVTIQCTFRMSARTLTIQPVNLRVRREDAEFHVPPVLIDEAIREDARGEARGCLEKVPIAARTSARCFLISDKAHREKLEHIGPVGLAKSWFERRMPRIERNGLLLQGAGLSAIIDERASIAGGSSLAAAIS
jgi:hypothetical protein